MATTDQKIQRIMTDLIHGKTLTLTHKRTPAGYTLQSKGILYSYGDHYIIAQQQTEVSWLVNEDRYELKDHERHWLNSPYELSPRKMRRYSPTTERQKNSARSALTRAGFSPTDTMEYHGDYLFRLWTKEV